MSPNTIPPAKLTRIALCLECPLLQTGGVEVLVRKLIEGLAPQYEIILVSADKSSSELGKFQNKIFAHIYWNASQVTYANCRSLADQLKKLDVKLVHFHGGGTYSFGSRFIGRNPMEYCTQKNIPVLLTSHLASPLLEGFCGPQKPVWFKLLFFPLAKLSLLKILLSVTREYAVSKNDQQLLRCFFRPWKKHIRYLYHSNIDEQSELPIELDKREPLVLYVGTISNRKGAEILVEAFTKIACKHPLWKLLILGRKGQTEAVERLQQQINQANLGNRLIWQQNVTDAAIKDLMYRASLFVMPSLQEGLGLSLQEALYRGCPAIGSDIGGIPELIDHEVNGLLTTSGSVNELADKLDLLIDNDILRRQYAVAARPSIQAKGMTAKNMVEKHVQIYESILHSK